MCVCYALAWCMADVHVLPQDALLPLMLTSCMQPMVRRARAAACAHSTTALSLRTWRRARRAGSWQSQAKRCGANQITKHCSSCAWCGNMCIVGTTANQPCVTDCSNYMLHLCIIHVLFGNGLLSLQLMHTFCMSYSVKYYSTMCR